MTLGLRRAETGVIPAQCSSPDWDHRNAASLAALDDDEADA